MYKLKVEYLNGTKVTYILSNLESSYHQMKLEEQSWNYPVKSMTLKYYKEVK